MIKFEKVLKYYPDKTNKPTAKGIVIAAIYDFSWVLLPLFILAIAVLLDTGTPLFFETVEVLFLIVVITIGKVIILETALWWVYYLMKKRSTR